MNTDANLTLALESRAGSSPEAPLLLGPGSPITFARMNAMVWHCAQRLHDHGMRPGDVIAVTAISPLISAVALLAVARIGATNLPLPKSCGPLERRELVARTGARLLATDRAGDFEAGIPELLLDPHRLLNERPTVDRSILDPHPTTAWQINRGSGSTGDPKLIPVTHAQASGRARLQNAVLGTTAEGCLGSMSGFDFNTGRQVLLRAIEAGARCAVLSYPGADPLALAEQTGVTELGLSVFHADQITADGPGGRLAKLARLRLVTVAGSTVSTGLRLRLRAVIGDRLWVHYGTNEASMITVAAPPEVFETEGTVGRPLPGVELEIVDAKGDPVPAGEIGEIRVRNPLACTHYLNDAAADRVSFRDGFFYPGDLGHLTGTGELIFDGRSDHMMIYNGINIYPEEIERALRSHPAVGDVAVVPQPSARHHELPVAAVALRAGAQASAEELLAYARARLGVHGPALLRIIDRVPRNELGKLIRADLSRLLSLNPT